MNLPTAILTIRWMVRDTFRQSLATRLFWVMMTVSIICILLCLSVSATDSNRLPVEPGEAPLGLPKNDPLVKKLGPKAVQEAGVDVGMGSELKLGFGNFTVTTARDKRDSVRFLQVWLAGIAADTVGILLVLIWTAGFMPTFLDPNQVTVLLAKPVPRWSLLVGKYLGVLAFVGMQAGIFIFGTWLALGLKTGVFDALYLMALPLLIIHFAIFYSFSVLLAVWSRSTVVCVFGSIVFWLVCWGMNFGRHALDVHQVPGLSPVGKTIVEVGYWTLPKPGDMNLLLYDALQADNFSMKVPEFRKLQEMNRFHPELSILASLLFAVVILGIAGRELQHMDY
jgi:hypothetical protein